MNVHVGRRGTLAAIGLIGAATLWAVNTQLGEVLPYPDCRHHAHFSGLSSLAAAVASGVVGWCSWRAYRALECSPERASNARRALRLLAGIGGGATLLFLFALVLQAAAGFILTGCER